MKKMIPALVLALALYMHTQAQQPIPVQVGIQLKPDIENPEGCVLAGTDIRHTTDEQLLSLGFNMQQLQLGEDVKYYFGEAANGEVNLQFRRTQLLDQVLSKEYSDQPMRIDGLLNINGQNVPAMFEVIKKKNKQKEVYSELTFSIPYQSMGIIKQGEVRMVLTMKSL
ncbi:MAG: hypothetical protein V4658_04345 [Bacteroidota bacterium]